MGDDNILEKAVKGVGGFIDEHITGSAGELTSAAADKIAGTRAFTKDQAKGIIPWLAGGAATLIGIALLTPINWLVKGVFSLLKNILTGFGLFEEIPLIGGLFSALGKGIDTVGQYAGLVVPAIAGFIGYKAFQAPEDPRVASTPPHLDERLALGGAGAGIGGIALGSRGMHDAALEQSRRLAETAGTVGTSRETALRTRLVTEAGDSSGGATPSQIRRMKNLLGENNANRIIEEATKGKDGRLTSAKAEAVLEYAREARTEAVAEARGSLGRRAIHPISTATSYVTGNTLGKVAEKTRDLWAAKRDAVTDRAIEAIQETSGGAEAARAPSPQAQPGAEAGQSHEQAGQPRAESQTAANTPSADGTAVDGKPAGTGQAGQPAAEGGQTPAEGQQAAGKKPGAEGTATDGKPAETGQSGQPAAEGGQTPAEGQQAASKKPGAEGTATDGKPAETGQSGQPAADAGKPHGEGQPHVEGERPATTAGEGRAAGGEVAEASRGVKAGVGVDTFTGRGTTAGLTYIHSAKALFYYYKGDINEAMKHATAGGGMLAMDLAFHNPQLQKLGGKALLGITEKVGAKNLGIAANKVISKIAGMGMQVGGREIPLVGAGVSLAVSGYSASQKEKTGEKVAELSAGTGEAALGTLSSVIGLGFVGGEIGREAVNGVSYLVSGYSGDPSISRMLYSEGYGLITIVRNRHAIGQIEPSHLDDQSTTELKGFEMADGHKVILPVMKTYYPAIPQSIKERVSELPAPLKDEPYVHTQIGQYYRMMGQAKHQRANNKLEGIVEGKRFAEVHDQLSRLFTDMETYEDSARMDIATATRFNEESRPKLIEELRKATPYLNGRRPEDIVPELNTGKDIGLPEQPKMTKEKYPDAYAFLQHFITKNGLDKLPENEGRVTSPDQLSVKQQHHIIRESAALEGMSGSDDHDWLLRVYRDDYGGYMKNEYVPYAEKLRTYQDKLVANNYKAEGFLDEYNAIRKRQQIDAIQNTLAKAREESGVNRSDFQRSGKYREQADKVAAADTQFQRDRSLRSELNLLDAKADMYKIEMDYIEQHVAETQVTVQASEGDLGELPVDNNLPNKPPTGPNRPRSPTAGG